MVNFSIYGIHSVESIQSSLRWTYFTSLFCCALSHTQDYFSYMTVASIKVGESSELTICRLLPGLPKVAEEADVPHLNYDHTV